MELSGDSKRREVKIFKDLDPVVGLVTLLSALMIWIYSTFAQISYVKELHVEAVAHSDANRDRMLGVLQEIRESVKVIEAHTWEMERKQSERGNRNKSSE